MPILFSFDYPPSSGGISRLCAELAQGLHARGISVSVLSQQGATDKPHPAIPDVLTRRVPARRPVRELAAWRVLFGQRQSACISGIWYPEGLIAQAAGCRKHVILAHGAELFGPESRFRRGLWRWLQRQTLEHATGVIANSSYTARWVTQVAPKARVVDLPLAVDHERFCPQPVTEARSRWDIAPDTRVVCSVSRIHRYKGHETVLEALPRLAPTVRARFLYLVAGTGPDQPYLADRARQLGVADQVRWLGFVADDGLPSLYSASDLFVLMTRNIPEEGAVEGFGLVFLEAQACGTPVVGAATGGIPDAIHPGDGGWLLPQDDAQSLARLLSRLNTDPAAFREMGAKARLRVERECTWDHYVSGFLAACDHLGMSLNGH